jgi:hypothetical protein
VTRRLAVGLIVVGLAAIVLAWTQRHAPVSREIGGWTAYAASTTERYRASGAFDGMRVFDGRLWFGVGVAFVAAGLLLGLVPWRRSWVVPASLWVMGVVALVLAFVERGRLVYVMRFRDRAFSIDVFDGLPLLDARVWLGAGAGLIVSALVVGLGRRGG